MARETGTPGRTPRTAVAPEPTVEPPVSTRHPVGHGPPENTTEPDEAVAPAVVTHDTSTVERGAFSHARCDCGWRGPARRSRDLARTDGTAHSAS